MALLLQSLQEVRARRGNKDSFTRVYSTRSQGQDVGVIYAGDHYWVRANAAPMRRNGHLVGYMSVRTRPSRTDVKATDSLYCRFKDGKASSLAFHRGLLVRTGLMRWTSALQTMSAAWRVCLALLVVGVASGVALSFSSVDIDALTTIGMTMGIRS